MLRCSFCGRDLAYVHGHAARTSLRRTQTASFAFDLATRLIASINTSPNFKGACLQLVNELSKQFGLDRVALGWVRNDTVRTQAISDTEFFDLDGSGGAKQYQLDLVKVTR